MHEDLYILGIESSCDDTGAAILKNSSILSNVIAGQKVHEEYGGVVPELASRAHQKNIVPTVDLALKRAGIPASDLHAIAYTRGPGLLGSLIVGTNFAKGMATALNIPLIEVNHMHAHIMAHFIDEPNQKKPEFPFLCLTVSGGHTQIVRVDGPLQLEVLGSTIDDAAGEAFDKSAKLLGFPYPGGPLIDRHAKEGNPHAFTFAMPKIDGLDFSFSGLKTSILYFLQKSSAKNPQFIEENRANLCASIQHTIVQILLQKMEKAAYDANIKHIAIAGGVSANSGLRDTFKQRAEELNWELYIPPFAYCTDNAAMIAITGKMLYEAGEMGSLNSTNLPRWKI